MTVSSDTSRISANGNGATTVFSLSPMTFFDESTLTVTVVAADGTETEQTLTTDYTVTGGSGETGSITMVTAPASGAQLVVERIEPNTQGLELSFQNALPSTALEAALDKIVMQIQRLASSIDFGLNAGQTAYNAVSRRISNLANGTEDTDAVTLQQLEAAQITAGNVPTPADPGDNGKVLKAEDGAYDWFGVGELPVPDDPDDDGKPLVAGGGATAYEVLTLEGGGTGGNSASSARAGLDVLRLGLIAGVVPVTADRTMLETDRGKLISVTTGSVDRVVTMPDPTALPTNWMATIKKADNTDFEVQIETPNSETIDGHAAFYLKFGGDQVTIVSDGTNFHVISAHLKPVTTRYTASGTHTFTPGRNYVKLICVGGGGAGGGTDTTDPGNGSEGSGGGGGQTRIGLFPITTTTLAMTVGSGGNGDDGAGDNGTNTIAGGLLTADGGFGGEDGANDDNEVVTGGDGGNVGSVDASRIWHLKIDGGSGGNGVVHGNGTAARGYCQGHGGGSMFAPPALAMLRNQQQQDSEGYGQGGAGSSLTQSQTDRFGGDGGDGLIMVEEIY